MALLVPKSYAVVRRKFSFEPITQGSVVYITRRD